MRIESALYADDKQLAAGSPFHLKNRVGNIDAEVIYRHIERTEMREYLPKKPLINTAPVEGMR